MHVVVHLAPEREVTPFADEARKGWPPDSGADYRERIHAVTPADVQRTAKKLARVVTFACRRG